MISSNKIKFSTLIISINNIIKDYRLPKKISFEKFWDSLELFFKHSIKNYF
jgi:hypothetical protein